MKLSDLNEKDYQVESSAPLKLSDLHSDDYKISNKPDEDISGLQSVAEGTATGATLGLKPILAGATQAGMDTLTGVSSPSDLLERYRMYRDKEKQSQDKIQAANPKLFMGGEFVGGTIPAIAMGGSNIAGAGSSALDNAVMNGAKFGGIAGFANSKGDLTKGEFNDVAKDTVQGVEGGMLTGGLLHGAMSGLGSLKDKIMGSATARAGAKGLEGVDLGNIEEHANELGNVTNKLVKGTEDIRDSLVKKDYPKVLDAIKDSDKSIDVKDQLVQYLQKAQDLEEGSNPGEAHYEDAKKLKDFILQRLEAPEPKINVRKSFHMDEDGAANKASALVTRLKSKAKFEGKPKNYDIIPDEEHGLFNVVESDLPSEAPDTNFPLDKLYDLKRKLSGMTTFGDNADLKTIEGKNLVKQMTGDVSDLAKENIPGLPEVDAKYKAIKDAQDVLGIKPDDISVNPLNGREEVKPSVFNRISNEIRRMETDESTASLGANNKLQQALDRIKAVDPDFANQIAPEIQNASENINLSRQANKSGLLHKNLLGFIKGNSMSLANKAGLAAKPVVEAIKPTVDGIKNFSSWSGDKLSNLVDSVSADGDAGQKIANVLREAVNRDDVGKNALLFSLMQNPTYREILNKHIK